MIVDELVKIQKQRRLTNRQMADNLGIHRISYYRNKRTKVIGAAILLRAFEVYPELRESFLSSITDRSLRPSDKRGGSVGSLLVDFLKGLIKRG